MNPARSYLFVPANRPERYTKAIASGADAVIFDLEDAVPPSEKSIARDHLASWLTEEKKIIVRVNAVDTEWFSEDLRLLSHPGVAGVMLPKAEGPNSVRMLKNVRNDFFILPLIETARGIDRMNETAIVAGVRRLVFGSIDLQTDMEMQCDEEELLFFRSAIVLSSRLANLQSPIDGVCTSIDDSEKLTRETLRAKRLGFGAKLCIHPRQVPVVVAAFSPSADEISWAQRVIDADSASGGAAVSVDGKMIDRPVVLRAMAVLHQLKVTGL